MRVIRIYYPNSLSIDETIALTQNAANHVGNVLRMKVGDELVLFNGDGYAYIASISAISKKQVHVTITQQLTSSDAESPLRIHLIQAVARGEKMDWIIQKATELGVTSITPIVTEHGSVRMTAERWAKRLEHWQGIIIGACEQCERNRLPQLHSVVDFDHILQQPSAGERIMFTPEASQSLLPNSIAQPQEITVLIGPEGGFSSQEREYAVRQGYELLTLGPRILRVETASLAALSILQAYFGDLR